MNGLIFLLRSAESIPNEIPRILYSISSRDGTGNREKDRIVHFINAYNLKIRGCIYQREEATLKRLKTIVSPDSVVVSDVKSGDHAVLITGISGEGIRVFDPHWQTVRSGLRNRIRGAKFNLTEPTFNAIVGAEEFFKQSTFKHGRLRMGSVSSRCWVQLSRLPD